MREDLHVEHVQMSHITRNVSVPFHPSQMSSMTSDISVNFRPSQMSRMTSNISVPFHPSQMSRMTSNISVPFHPSRMSRQSRDVYLLSHVTCSWSVTERVLAQSCHLFLVMTSNFSVSFRPSQWIWIRSLVICAHTVWITSQKEPLIHTHVKIGRQAYLVLAAHRDLRKSEQAIQLLMCLMLALL